MTNSSGSGTTLVGLKRRTGGLGIFGMYAEAVMPDGTRYRALLAGDILSTTSLTPSAKGSRWTTVSHGTSDAARNELAKFMSGTDEVSALAVELTQQDINRLQRGVLSTVVYAASDTLSEGAQ